MTGRTLQRTLIPGAVAAICAATALGPSAWATARQSAAAKANASCAPAVLHHSASPSWVGTGLRGTPYALASGGRIAAFFFRYPLRAGHPTSPRNKILWIAAAAAASAARTLKVTAHLASSTRPAVRFAIPAASGSGSAAQFPSIIDLPQAGCWQLALSWRDHSATIAIQVAPQ